MRKLSVAIPVFNEPHWIASCYESLVVALTNAGLNDSHIIIVDDGSDLPTQIALRSCVSSFETSVIRQENRGRLLARRAGLEAANGEWLLFIDARTLVNPFSLKFVFHQIDLSPDRRVWNAHTEMNVLGDPYNRFWRVITSIAWRDYLANPRDVSIGIESFDRFPKGTTCLLAPRDILNEAFSEDLFLLHDLAKTNDDTTVLRKIVRTENININPEFSCTYYGRGNSLKKFLTHSVHRGTVFLDGHLIEPNRYRYLLWGFFVCNVLGLFLLILAPLFFGFVVFALYFFVALVLVRLNKKNSLDNLVFLLLLLPFSLAYGVGLWKGLFSFARQKL